MQPDDVVRLLRRCLGAFARAPADVAEAPDVLAAAAAARDLLAEAVLRGAPGEPAAPADAPAEARAPAAPVEDPALSATQQKKQRAAQRERVRKARADDVARVLKDLRLADSRGALEAAAASCDTAVANLPEVAHALGARRAELAAAKPPAKPPQAEPPAEPPPVEPPREPPAPPAWLVCPITDELFVDPVSTCDGHVYERAAIERWLHAHDSSPRTGAPLASKALIPCFPVKQQAGEWRDRELTATEDTGCRRT